MVLVYLPPKGQEIFYMKISLANHRKIHRLKKKKDIEIRVGKNNRFQWLVLAFITVLAFELFSIHQGSTGCVTSDSLRNVQISSRRRYDCYETPLAQSFQSFVL